MNKFRALFAVLIIAITSLFVGGVSANAATPIKISSCHSFSIHNGVQNGGQSWCTQADAASIYHFHRVYIACRNEAGSTGWITGPWTQEPYYSIKFCPSSTQTVEATSYQLSN